jgi:hypothetical protein
VSDRDPRFMLRFLGKFENSLGSDLNFITAAHPQTDSQSKRVIQILKDTLRAYVFDFEKEWIESLSYARLAYHNSYESSIGMASFEVLYGRKCQTLLY